MNNIIETLKQYSDVTLFSHIHPDGDTIGSQIALAEALSNLGVQVKCFNVMDVPENFKFLEGSGRIHVYQDDVLDDVVCFVDCGDIARTGIPEEALSGKTIFNIDHHPSNQGYGAYHFVDPEASSTCEVLYHLFKAAEIQFTPAIATALYLGMSTDTGSFKYGNTGVKTHEAAADLLRHGAKTDAIRVHVYENISLEKFKLLGYMYSHTNIALDGKVAYLSISEALIKELQIKDEDYTGISGMIKEISGVEVAVLLRSLSAEKTKLSFRSKSYFDVNALASSFGGGGHVRAAGATLDLPLEVCEEKVLAALEQSL